MAKNKVVPGSGNVEVHLKNETVVLKPSLEACIAISRMHNSIIQTVEQIRSMDFDTIVRVFCIGIGEQPSNKWREKIYRTGVTSVASPLIQFVTIVNNGGKPPSENDEDDTITEDTEGDDAGNQVKPSQKA